MALYGKQTELAIENFDLQHRKTAKSLVYSIVLIKKAAALTYAELEVENSDMWHAMVKACDDILDGKYEDEFVVEALQGGAGTSTHMNVNEVIASLTTSHLNNGVVVHPLDDVNRGQSTNDVFPTALRIAAIEALRVLSDECSKLQESLQQQEIRLASIRKLGRTELMDAIPITMGESFGAYAQAIARDRWRLYKVEERLRQVNIGGTAVGNGLNANHSYRFRVYEHLRNLTNMGLAAAEYPMDITQNNDVFVEVSGLLKAHAINLMKIANDFRLLSSGPNGGIGELHLAPMQQGSSIMPGKVNPVIPEMVMQVAMRIAGNDTTISMAAAHGELELNAFEPLIADCLLESLTLLQSACHIFRTRCVELLEVDKERCQHLLEHSFAFATEYTMKVGYDVVSDIISR